MKKQRFQNVFLIMVENWEVDNDRLFIMLEEFVCQLYGYRNKSTDRVRFQIYGKKYTKENKVIDMTALPPCSSVLWLHILKFNMGTSLWKRSTTASFTMLGISQHGWDFNGNIQWAEDVFPTDVEDILLHEEYQKHWWILRRKWWRVWIWRWNRLLNSKILIHIKISNETPFSCNLYNGAE